MASITDFKQKFKIDDFAFEWTLMNVMASMQMWPQLAALFIKPVSEIKMAKHKFKLNQ